VLVIRRARQESCIPYALPRSQQAAQAGVQGCRGFDRLPALDRIAFNRWPHLGWDERPRESKKKIKTTTNQPAVIPMSR
jgi:hypothetical protein